MAKAAWPPAAKKRSSDRALITLKIYRGSKSINGFNSNLLLVLGKNFK